MDLVENLRIALAALQTNKLRLMLTMLGIVIGVSAVIAMMAVDRAPRPRSRVRSAALVATSFSYCQEV